MSTISDTKLIAFKTIVGFVKDCSSTLGEDIHSLKLYEHLLAKTTFDHLNSIEKNVELFRKFCTENRDNIENMNYESFDPKTIVYSDKIKLDMFEIFKKADADDIKNLWKHLLTISAIVDQAGHAKKILKKIATNDNSKKTESNFLTDMVSKIESNVDPNTSNPLEAIGGLMSSGVFNELIEGFGNGIKDGSIDMGNLMGTVQGMMGSMAGGGVPTTNNSEGQMNDLTNMMSMLGPMLNQVSNTAPNQLPSDEEVKKELKKLADKEK